MWILTGVVQIIDTSLEIMLFLVLSALSLLLPVFEEDF